MDSTQIKTSRKRRVRTKNKNRIDRITEEDRLLKLHDKAQEMTYQLEEDKKKRDMMNEYICPDCKCNKIEYDELWNDKTYWCSNCKLDDLYLEDLEIKRRGKNETMAKRQA